MAEIFASSSSSVPASAAAGISSQCPVQTEASSSQVAETVKITGLDTAAPLLMRGPRPLMFQPITFGQVGEGLHPSELVVSVETPLDPEEVIIHPTSLQDDSVNIGWPVGREGNYFLVELPRPTISRAKRVWVSKNALVPDEGTRAIA